MKIVHISSSDTQGGAARAAYRLHRGLVDAGVDSRMFVGNKFSDDPTVVGQRSRFGRLLIRIQQNVEKMPGFVYPQLKRYTYSSAICVDNVGAFIAEVKPDIVHLHWVGNGFLQIESLRGFKRPIVWTLHDMWAFTGGCYLSSDCNGYLVRCGTCPVLGSRRQHDLSRWTWSRKRRSWGELKSSFVCPSRWLSECAGKSSLLASAPVAVIPNGLDLDRFKPLDKAFARSLFSLPPEKKLVVFGAMSSTSNPIKGFHHLVSAIRHIVNFRQADDLEIAVFGASKPEHPPELHLPTHYVGLLHDDISLAALYAAADVFVAPSIQENLPNTVMEALACGTPCVAFNIGGMPDLIEHQRTGYLAQAFDPEDLARGILWVLEDEERSRDLSQAARAKAVREYSLALTADRYLGLYNRIMGRF